MSEDILLSVNSIVFGVWFLIGAALVFWMQAGFAMVEAGFTIVVPGRTPPVGTPISCLTCKRPDLSRSSHLPVGKYGKSTLNHIGPECFFYSSFSSRGPSFASRSCSPRHSRASWRPPMRSMRPSFTASSP